MPIIVVSIFKVELSLTPDNIMSPLTRVGIAIVILNRTVAHFQSVLESTFISIPRTRYINTLPVHLIPTPLSIIKWAIWEQHLTPTWFLILIPFPVIYRTILVIIHSIPVSHDLSHIFGAIKIDQLIFDSLCRVYHLSNYVLNFIFIRVQSSYT